MNKEEKTPSYGDLYAENFRLKHNEEVLTKRINKAIEYELELSYLSDTPPNKELLDILIKRC